MSSQLIQQFTDYFHEQRQRNDSLMISSDRQVFAKSGDTTCPPTPVRQHSLQQYLRPAYGKGRPEPRTIGNHPDFDDLSGTQLARICPIVTMFMDIESSTRLGLWYDGEEVAWIKNAFLCTAIELVHAFDGHVHRIMGDAVMAFFGGQDRKVEDAAIDAINCASMVWFFVKSTVIPTLKQEGYDEDFGIRVGVDYAPQAYWCSYGFPGVEEVTATAFEVDAASKLQHSAGRNQIMLGQRIQEFLDLPEVVTAVKQVQRNGELVREPFLLPNHRLRDGKSNNYQQVLLRVEEYLKCSPLANEVAEAINGQRFQPLSVHMNLHKERGQPAMKEYCSSSFILPKDHSIKFELSLPFQPRLPFTVEFAVENHGKEAREHRGDNMGNHKTERKIIKYLPRQIITHWEDLKYRGLHYMTITVRDASRIITRHRLGVFIE